MGVLASQVDSAAELVAIGIPIGPNYIVEGTGGDDLIDGSYVADPEADQIDSNDHSDGTNFDSVQAGDGNDTVMAGAAGDSIDGGAGNDVLYGGGFDFTPAGVFSGDFNDLTTDPGITTSGGLTSGGSSSFQFQGASYVIADPDQGGADIGDVDSITITFGIDIASSETQPVSYSFGDPASLAANPSDRVTDGLTVQIDPATNEVVFLWDGAEIGREPAGYDVDSASPEAATLDIDANGLVTFTLPGAPGGPNFTAQIPGDEWAETDTSSYAFVAGMDPRDRKSVV